MHYYTLIKIVKSRRKSLKITQEQLSELSGVGLRTLKQFESGKANPTLETLSKIGDTLGLELKYQVKEINLLNENSESII